MINTEYLKTLNPCQNRLDNWIEHYNDWHGTLSEFLDLDKITYNDKLWVYFRSIPKQYIAPIVAEFAEQVLHIYEAYNPDSSALKEAIRCAKENDKDAAYAAARAADYAAEAAADDAAHAAYAAAYTAAHAAHAAYAAAYCASAIATTIYAANAADDAARAAHAAYAADDAARAIAYTARKDQKQIQIGIMKSYLSRGTI